MKSLKHPALLFLAVMLAACTEPVADLTPVLPPLSPAVVQQAEAGDAAAQFKLAEHYRATTQPALMLRWLEAAARGGHPSAQISLGVLYLAGDVAPANRVMAYAWFLRAADGGHADAVLLEGQLKVDLTGEEVQRGLALTQTLTAPPPAP